MAWRYLISKKSHNAVGAISVVAIVGMAVATAAMICVLSVFNGFRNSIEVRLDRLSPDVLITPAKGKVFEDADELAAKLKKFEFIEIATPTLTDNALAIVGSHEMPITLKGVDIQDFRKVVQLDSILLDTDDTPSAEANTFASVGAAQALHIFPDDQIMIFAPKRYGRVNMANPISSFFIDSITINRVFQSNQKHFDEDLIITDRNTVTELLQYDTEASAIEVKLKAGTNHETAVTDISNALGKDFIVKDRVRQQEMDFRMINIEKWVTFLLLFFILVIASFNVISSLSMLVLEKKKSLSTLRALGMNRRRIGSIFFWESIYVTAIGGISGIVVGILLCLAQQKFGFIKIAGDPTTLIMTAYPVAVDPKDIIITFIPVLIIGLITAWITSAYAKRLRDA